MNTAHGWLSVKRAGLRSAGWEAGAASRCHRGNKVLLPLPWQTGPRRVCDFKVASSFELRETENTSGMIMQHMHFNVQTSNKHLLGTRTQR